MIFHIFSIYTSALAKFLLHILIFTPCSWFLQILQHWCIHFSQTLLFIFTAKRSQQMKYCVVSDHSALFNHYTDANIVSLFVPFTTNKCPTATESTNGKHETVLSQQLAAAGNRWALSNPSCFFSETQIKELIILSRRLIHTHMLKTHETRMQTPFALTPNVDIQIEEWIHQHNQRK